MNATRSIIFNIFFFTLCLVILLSLWLALPFSRPRFRRAVQLWGSATFAVLKNLNGTVYEIRGRENLPAGPHILAAKHQSAWDTMFFLVEDPDTAYIMKEELYRIPLWGWYSRRARHIAINRRGGGQALRALIRESKAILEDGRSIVIFPEGTRVAPGETGTYFPGVAALYSQCGVPIVPVAVNSGLYWGRRSFRKYPGEIIVEYLPAIPDGLSRAEFMAALEQSIESATRRLEKEAQPDGALTYNSQTA